jgi:hypothetical protein
MLVINPIPALKTLRRRLEFSIYIHRLHSRDLFVVRAEIYRRNPTLFVSRLIPHHFYANLPKSKEVEAFLRAFVSAKADNDKRASL